MDKKEVLAIAIEEGALNHHLRAASKWAKEGNYGLAVDRMRDTLRSLEKLEKLIKKAN